MRQDFEKASQLSCGGQWEEKKERRGRACRMIGRLHGVGMRERICPGGRIHFTNTPDRVFGSSGRETEIRPGQANFLYEIARPGNFTALDVFSLILCPFLGLQL